MRSAALELAHNRITIDTVLPGNIHTEGLVDIGDDYLRKMEASIQRLCGGTIPDFSMRRYKVARDIPRACTAMRSPFSIGHRSEYAGTFLCFAFGQRRLRCRFVGFALYRRRASGSAEDTRPRARTQGRP